MIGSIYQLEDRLGESVRLFCPCEVEVTPAAYAALLCPLPRDSDHAPARSPSNPSHHAFGSQVERRRWDATAERSHERQADST